MSDLADSQFPSPRADVEIVREKTGIHFKGSAPGGFTAELDVTTDGPDKVKFTAGCGANGFATRWYKNARTEFGGRFVHVSAASVTSGINQTLPRG